MEPHFPGLGNDHQNKTRHSHAPLSHCTHLFPFHNHLPCRQHKLDLQGLRGPETARTLLAESQTPVIVLGGRVCAKGFRRNYAERAHRCVPMPRRPHRLRLPPRHAQRCLDLQPHASQIRTVLNACLHPCP